MPRKHKRTKRNWAVEESYYQVRIEQVSQGVNPRLKNSILQSKPYHYVFNVQSILMASYLTLDSKSCLLVES